MNCDQPDLQRTDTLPDILIVDDSPDNLRVLSATLAEEGYQTRCVKSGEMALIVVESAPPDLILLDIKMPHMDGYEVCQRLKENPQSSHIPVIFLSALDDAIDKIKAFTVGGADYITKPFQIPEVLARVNHQLAIRSLQKQLLEQNQQLHQAIEGYKRTEEALRQEIHYRALAEAALRDAKEAAEAADYTKSEFLARVSHELRTPLNAILGFAHLMQNDPALTSDHHRQLTIIHQSGERLLKLINNILSMTRLESNKIRLNESYFDLFELLETLYHALKYRAKAKRLVLNFERDLQVPRYVRSDEGKLRQVLTHLLDNAIKFTQQGSITLRLRWSDRPQGEYSASMSHILLFEIEDTGSGISQQELGCLFEAFSQTEVGRRSEQGVGLGLAISRRFVQLMGGDIWVSSVAGQGSVFRFTIQTGLQTNLMTGTTPGGHGSPPIDLAPHLAGTIDSTGVSEECAIELLQDTMPPEWIVHLHWAAVKGFDQSILQLIQDIPEHQAHLANALVSWTDNFQFDKIINLTQQITGLTSD